jgi:hypothetical protein
MFQRDRVTEDILVEMEKNLKKNAFEQKTQRLNKRSMALKLLNKAATNFEQAGLLNESEAVVRVMEIAADDSNVEKYLKSLKEHDMMESPSDKSEIEIEETEPSDKSKIEAEEDDLFEVLTSDPDVAEEIRVGETEDEPPTESELAMLWE